MTTIADIEGSSGGPAGVIVLEDIFNSHNNLKDAQTFQVIEGTWDVTSVNLRLDRNFTAAGSAETGNLTLSIKEDSATGAVLGTSAVERTDVSLTEAWKSFTFSGVELSSGNTYCLVLECPYGFDDKPVGVGGVGDDLIQWLIKPGVGGYADGTRYYYYDEIGWTLSATQDNRAIIYGDVSGPIKAKTPAPTDTATGMTLDYQQFSWESGSETPPDEEVYNVYWGTTSDELDTLILDEGPLTYMEPIYILAALGTGLYNETYYWRVDTYWPSTDETAEGDEWTVSTIAFSPPLPTGITLTGGDGDEGDPTGTPSGLNFMTAIRRLVVAANSKIWYEDV